MPVLQLESVSSKQRTGKINLALARLYQQEGRDRSALTSYKEVLRYFSFCYATVLSIQQLTSMFLLSKRKKKLVIF